MKYAIARVSQWNDAQPCEEAIRETIVIKKGQSIDRWTIEIESLEALMEFVDKYGDVIIYWQDFMDSGLPLLKIYDGYNE